MHLISTISPQVSLSREIDLQSFHCLCQLRKPHEPTTIQQKLLSYAKGSQFRDCFYSVIGFFERAWSRKRMKKSVGKGKNKSRRRMEGKIARRVKREVER